MLCVSSKELSELWWKSFLHLWQSYNERNTLTQAHRIQMNKVFAHCRRWITSTGNDICHQNLIEMGYPFTPSRQLSPNAVAVGILGMMHMMGVSQRMPSIGWSFLRRNSISWCIVLLILYLYFECCTSLAVHFIVKDMCLAWSLHKPWNVPVFKDWTIF